MGSGLWFLIWTWGWAPIHLARVVLPFVTIIGIPFGVQHLKRARLTLAPTGRTVVRTEEVPGGANVEVRLIAMSAFPDRTETLVHTVPWPFAR